MADFTRAVPLLGDLVSRLKGFRNTMGTQFGGLRDYYAVFGWKRDIQVEDYYAAFLRQDIAKKVISAPVDVTWGNGIRIVDDVPDSPFSEAANALIKQMRLWSVFARLDRLVGLGQYAVLVLGYDDTLDTKAFSQPVQSGTRRLLYMNPYSQHNAVIETWDQQTTSERFGKPEIYRTDIAVPGSTGQTTTLRVHHSRVIHVAEGRLESDVYGTPRLEAVYNRLDDLQKIVGGSAEMFWRGAFPGYVAKVASDAQLTTGDREALDTEFKEYEHNLRRWLRVKGVDVNSLSQQMNSPVEHVDVQLQMISAATGIPKRILVGSERGELASSQDETAWKEAIQSRRETFAEPEILRPVIDALIFHGVLPEPINGDYTVVWPDLFALGQQEKADIATKVTQSLATYINAPGASSVVPESMFLMKVLGWTQEDVDQALAELVDPVFEEEPLPESPSAAGTIATGTPAGGTAATPPETLPLAAEQQEDRGLL